LLASLDPAICGASSSMRREVTRDAGQRVHCLAVKYASSAKSSAGSWPDTQAGHPHCPWPCHPDVVLPRRSRHGIGPGTADGKSSDAQHRSHTPTESPGRRTSQPTSACPGLLLGSGKMNNSFRHPRIG